MQVTACHFAKQKILEQGSQHLIF